VPSLRVTVLLIDVDNFRAINTELGSEVGDQLLVAVGARMAQNTPPGALLARLRSDEFAILLPATPIEDVAPVADSILRQFRAPFLSC
jgi:diguanylate cyclase (GGDEF)-like protein